MADANFMIGKFDSAIIYYNILKNLFGKTNDSLILGYALKKFNGQMCYDYEDINKLRPKSL